MNRGERPASEALPLAPTVRAATSTIVAVASGSAPGGVGVLRVSGPDAHSLVRPMLSGIPETPEPRHAYFARFVDRTGAVLDEGLVLFFRGPHSFTGEDVVELQAHGSPRLLSLLERELLADPRARVAEPGEFTRRAFLNGRMDLTRAEAVADLVAAESEAAVRAAASQLRGGLSEAIAPLRAELLALHADVEGVLGFPDEAEGADAELVPRLDAIVGLARGLFAQAEQGRLIRRGARVVLFGPVNAGKSTLFNALLGEARALVDADAGTTRDVLEARFELRGLGVTLYDTAGLRAAPGRVEALGIARAKEVLAGADLALLLVPPESTPAEVLEWETLAGAVPVMRLLGHADVSRRHAVSGHFVSGQTGEGISQLREALAQRWLSGGEADVVRGVSERHAQCLRSCLDAVERAQTAAMHSTLEVVAGELTWALEALGEMTGEDVSASVLDAIFERFCIGK